MGEKNKQKSASLEEAQRKDEVIYKPASGKKIILFGLPLLGFVILFSLWFEFYKPKVTDEWYRGVMLVDSANKTTDQIIKKHLLDSGRQILQKQVQLHPYHARVWYLYGYYFLVTGNWDSCIYADKKAIELGAGGVVNSVEYVASEHLNYALEKKLSEVTDLENSMKVLNNASVQNFQNNSIDRFRGMIFYNYEQIDSSNFYLERFYKNVPNDFNVLSILAYNYFRLGSRDKALFYANEARKIKSDDPGLNNLINKLQSQ
jgi:tetratricopeptide (TPR) repeat protein